MPHPNGSGSTCKGSAFAPQTKTTVSEVAYEQTHAAKTRPGLGRVFYKEAFLLNYKHMQVIPHLQFIYSDIYDQQCRRIAKVLKYASPYPAKKSIIDFGQKLEREWEKNYEKVLKEISKTTNLAWKEKDIACYIVGQAMPISAPLTIPVFKAPVPIDYAVDVMIHELIHRILSQPTNKKNWQNIEKRLKKRWPKLNENTRLHILVQAIHEVIFLTVFDEHRLEREKRLMSEFADYRKAWSIIEKEGAENILDTIIK